MDWVVISALSEVVGTIAVVISLVYVALQIRQNTRAHLATSRQWILDGDLSLIGHFIEQGVDPHLVGDGAKISPEDDRRIVWMVIKALRVREFAWHQYRAGLLDEETWRSYLAPVPGLFSTARGRGVLDFYTGSDEFMSIIRQRVAEAESAKVETSAA